MDSQNRLTDALISKLEELSETENTIAHSINHNKRQKLFANIYTAIDSGKGSVVISPCFSRCFLPLAWFVGHYGLYYDIYDF